MLVNLQTVLSWAEEHHCAIGAFNTPNLECLNAVISAAERYHVPVIISHAELHEAVAPLSIIGPIMVQAAQRAKVPVCVHLDHCETLGYLVQALDIGFTGVMYDGSMLPYEENVANTIKATELAKPYAAGVEAEIGQLAAREGGDQANAGGPVYTDPDLALEFVHATGIDALAPSFGTSHGIYKEAPQLDLDRVARIWHKVEKPLVMHGGSGVSADDYRTAIRNGIRKINYYSYMSREGIHAAKVLLDNQEVMYFHDLALTAQKAMQADVERAMQVFYGIDDCD